MPLKKSVGLFAAVLQVPETSNPDTSLAPLVKSKFSPSQLTMNAANGVKDDASYENDPELGAIPKEGVKLIV
jgi:hypothetical protein